MEKLTLEKETLTKTQQETKVETETKLKEKKAKIVKENISEIKNSEKLFKASVIERPNYDLIQPKVNEDETEKEKVVVEIIKDKPKKKFRFKLAFSIVAVLTILFGSWTIASTIDLVNSSNLYNEAYSEYSMNLAKYLAKIHALDNTNKANEAVIPTFPEELKDASDFVPKTNWFDKLCDYISRLFGG